MDRRKVTLYDVLDFPRDSDATAIALAHKRARRRDHGPRRAARQSCMKLTKSFGNDGQVARPATILSVLKRETR